MRCDASLKNYGVTDNTGPMGKRLRDKTGAKVLHVCRKHRISDATFYNWKTKYTDITVAHVHA